MSHFFSWNPREVSAARWMTGEIVTGCYWCSNGINCCCFERRLCWYHWLVDPLECWWASSLSWCGPRAEDSFRVINRKEYMIKMYVAGHAWNLTLWPFTGRVVHLQGFLHEIWTPLTVRYVCHLAGGLFWLPCTLSTLTPPQASKLNWLSPQVPLDNINENTGLDSFSVHLNLHF